MFEKQRLKNRGFESLYERAEKCLKAHPYLQDFCTYLNKNRKLEWLETYLREFGIKTYDFYPMAKGTNYRAAT